MNFTTSGAQNASHALIFDNLIDLNELARRTGVPVAYVMKVFSDKMFLETYFESLFDKEKLAVKLNLSVSFINKLMRNEGLPYVKLGKAVRFRVSETLSWLQQRRMP